VGYSRQVLNAPVWQLLGGKMRDKLRLYWSHCGSTRARHWQRLGLPKVETTDDLRALAQEVLDRGSRIKTNIMTLRDLPDASGVIKTMASTSGEASPAAIRTATTIIRTFREALGPDVGIALDVAFSFKLGGAIKLAQALEPYNLMWLEAETLDPQALRFDPRIYQHHDLHRREHLRQHGYKPYWSCTLRTSSCPTWHGMASPWARSWPITPTPTMCSLRRTTATAL
jgi:hypothetical protein